MSSLQIAKVLYVQGIEKIVEKNVKKESNFWRKRLIQPWVGLRLTLYYPSMSSTGHAPFHLWITPIKLTYLWRCHNLQLF